MSTVQEIEQAVRRLTPEELSAFRNWFVKYDALLWDREIEQDADSGRLDALVQEALADQRDGRCTDLARGATGINPVAHV